MNSQRCNRFAVSATPLWLAARFAEPDIMQALIEGGADPFFLHDIKYPGQRMGENFMVEEGKISILMAAVGMGHRRLRLSWWTPERRAGQLSRSREEFMLDAVSVALRAGVDPALENSDGESALSFARARRYDAVAGFLESIGSAQ
jgi:ankyrin repeat protein